MTEGYPFGQIAEVLGGTLIHAGGDAPVRFLVNDSRRVVHPENSLFFALRTGRRDGHDFLQDAYREGVRYFIVNRELSPEMLPDAGILQVPDTLEALQRLAAWHRSRFRLPVVGVTGSNGKTIVKEWLYQLLQEDFRIVRSPRSFNSQIGVPLSVWQIQPEHTLGVFEAGISQPGEMSYLEPVIQPRFGILTNIGAPHDEGFQDRVQKAREKLLLFVHAEWLVYCDDDALLREQVAWFRANVHPTLKIFSWARKRPATLSITEVSRGASETRLTALFKDKAASVTIPFTDEASIENAIHCWCMLYLLRVLDQRMRSAMEGLQPVAMRLELKKAIHRCTLINDSYSSDLDSLYIALDYLEQQRQHPVKTLILSDLQETGIEGDLLYPGIARTLQRKNVRRLIAIGPGLKKFGSFFDEVPERLFYDSTEAFLRAFHQIPFRDEAILLKGARSFAFERISRLLELQAHQTVLEIDLGVMAANLEAHRRLLRPGVRVMAMVKAFSYGSGSYEIASFLEFHKVDYLAVAYADEGVHLRHSGITFPIMVMNPEPNTFDTLVQHRLEPELFSFALLRAFRKYLEEEGLQRYPVHIKLDTGMHRLGFLPPEVDALAGLLHGDTNLEVKSVFSHLSAGEDPAEDAFTATQAALFLKGCKLLEKALRYPFLKHLGNTAGLIRHPDLQFDMVRLGIGLYGINSAGTPSLPLQEVSTLKTTVAQVHRLEAGETVGYNRRGRVSRPSVVATVRIGYADGYTRRLGNGVGKMLINGRLAPTIGQIAMDMAMLDVTDIPGVSEGDEVIVFGAALPVVQVAAWAGTIPYEVLTGVSARVRRVYFEQ